MLYTGTRTFVYKAIRESDRQQVTVKVLRYPNPTFNQLVQFRNQYVITRHLQHPRIVQPLALERQGNGYALVMPDHDAVSGSHAPWLIALSEYWQTSFCSLWEVLPIAIQIAEALHYLTRHSMIHKDIKPTNILIHRKTKQVQLISASLVCCR